MNIQTVTLSQLVPSKANPRKAFDANGIEGLAASIRTDRLLQNLVVTPVNGKGERFRIISGERRYRALKLLDERGELPEDFGITVEIREGLSKDDRLRLATVENLQRQNLSPLEDAAALTALVRKGERLDDVVAETGLSETTIRRRLALNGLCEAARQALSDGAITLAQAEALTLGGDEAQAHICEEIREGHYAYTPEEIRETFLDDRPSLAMAIFPREDYTGTITTDLFGEEETSYFDDVEQFFELQKEAVEQLAHQHREAAAWVEVTDNYRIPHWQYREAEEGEIGGVIINLSPSGEVEVREGLIAHDIDEDTAEATADNPAAPKRVKASYSAPLRRYIAHHKSMAVQELLLTDPRKAKEVAAVRDVLDLRVHVALLNFAEAEQPPAGYGVLDTLARRYAAKLGFETGEGERVWDCFPPPEADDVDLYEAIKGLSDHELDELHTLIAALRFGQEDCDALDCGESLFNTVAQDLGTDMKNHWRPEAAFLGRRTKTQLLDIAQEFGYADLHGAGRLTAYKKGELVNGLLRHFELAHAAEQPTPAQAKALAWLPEVMQFPAIDPDADDESSDEQA